MPSPESETPEVLLRRLMGEHAIGQLRARHGRMAQLSTENGRIMLDWVDGIQRLLTDSLALEALEQEAGDLLRRGHRFIIWSGMGGSVMAVRALVDLLPAPKGFTILPLDSTDPAALNHIIRQIAESKVIDLETADMHTLLHGVMMIGVSMGMTSEEPITHLEWFANLLGEAGLPLPEHMLVMTLHGSMLERFALERGFPTVPLQLDGGAGTGGRMSAPTTRVFLLPVALYLAASGAPVGRLREILMRAWELYDLDGTTVEPGTHPYVRLAVAMAAAAENGVCRLLLRLPSGWEPLMPWIEQLMEESLGKGGKGVLVFDSHGPYPQRSSIRGRGTLHVWGDPDTRADDAFQLPAIPNDTLVALTVTLLGWQLCMALYGYLHDIPFAGQPAVENYKSLARSLRESGDPLRHGEMDNSVLVDDRLTLFLPEDVHLPEWGAAACLEALAQRTGGLDYLDVTFNGEISPQLESTLGTFLQELANHRLGVPFKLRRAPAAYHSTEQSEMDGSPRVVSLRLVARRHQQPILGTYPDTFLLAQAAATWLAVVGAGRACGLLVIDGLIEDAMPSLQRFFSTPRVEGYDAHAPRA